MAVRIDELPGDDGASSRSRARSRPALHQVDSPAFDGARPAVCHAERRPRHEGAGAAVSRRRATASREPIAVEIANPTSLALGPDGALYVSSRFDGHVYRLIADDRVEIYATELGVPTGLAFGARRHRCSSAIGRDRSSASRRSAGRDVRDAAGQRRGVSPGVRAGRVPVRHGADARDARSDLPHHARSARGRRLRRLRPAAGAGVRLDRRRCTSSTRWPARRACIGSTSATAPGRRPSSWSPRPALIGVAFDPRRRRRARVERHDLAAGRRPAPAVAGTARTG